MCGDAGITWEHAGDLELKATGKNARSALLLGVPTERTSLSAFMVCGALAGLAGAYRVLFTFGTLRPLSSGEHWISGDSGGFAGWDSGNLGSVCDVCVCGIDVRQYPVAGDHAVGCVTGAGVTGCAGVAGDVEQWVADADLFRLWVSMEQLGS